MGAFGPSTSRWGLFVFHTEKGPFLLAPPPTSLPAVKATKQGRHVRFPRSNARSVLARVAACLPETVVHPLSSAQPSGSSLSPPSACAVALVSFSRILRVTRPAGGPLRPVHQVPCLRASRRLLSRPFFSFFLSLALFFTLSFFPYPRPCCGPALLGSAFSFLSCLLTGEAAPPDRYTQRPAITVRPYAVDRIPLYPIDDGPGQVSSAALRQKRRQERKKKGRTGGGDAIGWDARARFSCVRCLPVCFSGRT